MDDHGGQNKISGIKQIVKLKEILQKWQNNTLGPKGSPNNSHVHNNDFESSVQGPSGISPAICRRLKNTTSFSGDSDEEGCQSPEPPFDVPRGYLAVYVGPELRRFIIPTCYLSDPLFKVLLEKVEEEFGFDHSGGLTIPCEIETFKYLLKVMENHQKNLAQNNTTAVVAAEE